MSPGSNISNAHASAIYYTISPPKGADCAIANQQGAARSVWGDEKPIYVCICFDSNNNNKEKNNRIE